MHIHILGICGTFMGGVAALAREAGHTVTGCDSGVYPPMSDQLRALGIELIEGFGAGQLSLKPDMFVVGNVVSRAHLPDGSAKFPLMEAILDAGLPYTSGPQWLFEHVLQGRHVLAVAGTHGKTTTTSMLAWILECAGLAPGFLVGGVPLNFGVSARLGQKYFVIEADEYDTAFFDKRSKFVHYRPRTAVLNNLEFDHADIFDNLAAIERQFHHLVRTVPASGRVVVNGAEASLQRVLEMGCWSEQVGFGTAEGAMPSQWHAIGTPDDFDVLQNNERLGHVSWQLQGMHNQNNALAAMAAAQHVGVSPQAAAEALGSFENVKRRMEVRGTVGGVTVYDDFAHHPSAIATTLDGLSRHLGRPLTRSDQPPRRSQRIMAVLEPRSNTMKLGTMKAQLADSLKAADLVFCHSGGLGWDPREPLAVLGDRAQVADTIDELVNQVMQTVQPGDTIVCMSNGGFGGIHGKLLAALQRKAELT
ncbi:MAG: UDP-N-acetylmuramate:L-alanyl-gamma-D-glutamyl-meso-diaminopimelate ligase [Burkholderiaceae bacterium]|nr:UDP-N-acetylmuramate:L-alanyl-gamma-D-glutamyl-meso-diaminopimelate ligase [Burkholderiaceae bacterium]